MCTHKYISFFIVFIVLSVSLMPFKIVSASELSESFVDDNSFNINSLLSDITDEVVSSDSLELSEFPDFYNSGFNGISSWANSNSRVGREDVLSSPPRFLSSVIVSMITEFVKSEIKKQNPYATNKQVDDYFNSVLLNSGYGLDVISQRIQDLYFTLPQETKEKIRKGQEWVLNEYGGYRIYQIALRDLMDMGFGEIFDTIVSELNLSNIISGNSEQWGPHNSTNSNSDLFEPNYYNGFIPIGFNTFMSGWNHDDILEDSNVWGFDKSIANNVIAPYIAQYGYCYALWVDYPRFNTVDDAMAMLFVSNNPFSYDIMGPFSDWSFTYHDPSVYYYPNITYSGSISYEFLGDYGPPYDASRPTYYVNSGGRFYFLCYNGWRDYSVPSKYDYMRPRGYFSAYLYADAYKPVDINLNLNGYTFENIINYYNDNSVYIYDYGDIIYNDNSTNNYITINFPDGFWGTSVDDNNNDEILESLNELINLLMEDLNNLQKNIIEAIDNNGNFIGGKIDNLDTSLNAINEDTKKINSKMDNLEDSLNAINKDTNKIVLQIGDLLEKFDSLGLIFEGSNERLEAVIIMLILILGLAFIFFILWLCIQIWRFIWSHMIQVWF